MKINRNSNYLAIAGLVCGLILMTACGAGKVSSAKNSNSVGTNTQSKYDAPAIEIDAADLAKEWMTDPASTDAKYAGKKVKMAGEFKSVASDASSVYLVGVATTPQQKGVDIKCYQDSVEGAAKLLSMRDYTSPELKKAMGPNYKMPNPIPVIRGVYLKSSPADTGLTAIEIKPCQLPF